MASFLSTENTLTNYRTRELLDWAMTHSIIMALPPADAYRMTISHAPFTLTPYPFPADRFRKVRKRFRKPISKGFIDFRLIIPHFQAGLWAGGTF